VTVPIYEYYCENCDKAFEALRPMREASEPVPCPTCARDAGRVMPTSFAAMSFRQGHPQRVPFHHRPVRQRPARSSASAKPNAKAGGKRSQKMRSKRS